MISFIHFRKRKITSESIIFKKCNCHTKYKLDSERQDDTSSGHGIETSKKKNKKKNYKRFVNLRVT